MLEKSNFYLEHLNEWSDSTFNRFLVVRYNSVKRQVFSINLKLVGVCDRHRKCLFLHLLSRRCGNLSLCHNIFWIVFVEKEVLVYCYVLLRVHFCCYWPHFLFFHRVSLYFLNNCLLLNLLFLHELLCLILKDGNKMQQLTHSNLIF